MSEMEEIVVETSRYGDEWNFYYRKQIREAETVEYITSVSIPEGFATDQNREIERILNGLCEVFTFVLNKK
jgi:hypothetical protein